MEIERVFLLSTRAIIGQRGTLPVTPLGYLCPIMALVIHEYYIYSIFGSVANTQEAISIYYSFIPYLRYIFS